MQGLRLGTRGSPLALAQARKVAAAIETAQRWPEGYVEIVTVTTTGDKVQDRPLADIGGKALWTKELDKALLAGEVDFCVHSMKDVESERPAEIHIAAVRPRGDVRDRIVGAESIEALKQGATVGTSSPRRKAQLLRLRPDLKIVPIRGNVETRIAKVEAGEVDATLLAAAGLEAAVHRDRHVDPDRDHPARAGPGGDRHRMPHQRHAHAERADQRQQPDHLRLRDGRARVHAGAGRDLRLARCRLLRARGRRPPHARAIVQRGRQRDGRRSRDLRLRR